MARPELTQLENDTQAEDKLFSMVVFRGNKRSASPERAKKKRKVVLVKAQAH